MGIWHTAPGLGFELINQSPALHFTYLEENQTFESVGIGFQRPEAARVNPIEALR